MKKRFDVREIEFYNVIGAATYKLDEITGKTFREILGAGVRNVLSVRCDSQLKYKYILTDTVDDLALEVMQYRIRTEIAHDFEINKLSIEAFHYLLKLYRYNIETYDFNGRVIYSLVEDGYNISNDTELAIFDFIMRNGYFPATKYLYLEVFLRFLKKYTTRKIDECCGRNDIQFDFPKNTVFQEDDEEYFNHLLDIAEYYDDNLRFGEFEFEYHLCVVEDDNEDGTMWLIEPDNKESAKILQPIIDRVFGDF